MRARDLAVTLRLGNTNTGDEAAEMLESLCDLQETIIAKAVEYFDSARLQQTYDLEDYLTSLS